MQSYNLEKIRCKPKFQCSLGIGEANDRMSYVHANALAFMLFNCFVLSFDSTVLARPCVFLYFRLRLVCLFQIEIGACLLGNVITSSFWFFELCMLVFSCIYQEFNSWLMDFKEADSLLVSRLNQLVLPGLL